MKVPGASEFTGQSIGLPTALPGSGKAAARGLSPLPSSSPGPGRAIRNPFDCPVNSEAPGTRKYSVSPDDIFRFKRFGSDLLKVDV